MDRRTAKREACFRAALALDDLLAQGWEVGLAETYGEDAAEKVSVGLNELVAELATRGGKVPW